ncbi:MAG TPA: hypothetical protein VE968_00400 [Sphingomicrobium sp.]|nr:hypothetical protein [Sphingomicrobium sp.]
MTPREALGKAFERNAAKRSLSVAVLVGTLLNAINQGPEMISGHWPIVWKLVLTYFVPFAVASYASYAAYRSTSPNEA